MKIEDLKRNVLDTPERMTEELVKIFPPLKYSLLYKIIEEQDKYDIGNHFEFYYDFYEALLKYYYELGCYHLNPCDPDPETMLLNFIAKIKRSIMVNFDPKYIGLYVKIEEDPFNPNPEDVFDDIKHLYVD